MKDEKKNTHTLLLTKLLTPKPNKKIEFHRDFQMNDDRHINNN